MVIVCLPKYIAAAGDGAASCRFLNRDVPLHWRMNRDYPGLNILSMGIRTSAFAPSRAPMAVSRHGLRASA
jgi:hypothetical protein